MLTAECQAEERNLDTEFTLIHDFKPGMLNERFPVALKQAERRNKILQEERNSVIMGHEKDTMVYDYATNVQTDTSFHSETQNDKQENQSNKKVHKKSMIQQTLLQSYDNIRNRLRSLGKSTLDRDLMNNAKTTAKL